MERIPSHVGGGPWSRQDLDTTDSHRPEHLETLMDEGFSTEKSKGRLKDGPTAIHEITRAYIKSTEGRRGESV